MTVADASGRRRGLPPSGFTLIEVMIVVAMVAILASVAYPSYTEYVKKGKRGEGRAALTQMLMDQERFYTQNNVYRAFGTGATGTGFKTYAGDSATGTAYLLSAAACAGQTLNECVLLSAVPQFNDPEAGTLTLSSTGPRRSCTGTAASTNPKLCWP